MKTLFFYGILGFSYIFQCFSIKVSHSPHWIHRSVAETQKFQDLCRFRFNHLCQLAQLWANLGLFEWTSGAWRKRDRRLPESLKKLREGTNVVWRMTKIWIYGRNPWNGGTPNSSILIGLSIIHHQFWGTPIYGNLRIFYKLSIFVL